MKKPIEFVKMYIRVSNPDPVRQRSAVNALKSIASALEEITGEKMEIKEVKPRKKKVTGVNE